MVAFGLLGECPRFDEVVVNSADADLVRAWVLGGILADWSDAESRLDGAVPKLEGSVRRDVEQALRRVRAGYLPSAIE